MKRTGTTRAWWAATARSATRTWRAWRTSAASATASSSPSATTTRCSRRRRATWCGAATRTCGWRCWPSPIRSSGSSLIRLVLWFWYFNMGLLLIINASIPIFSCAGNIVAILQSTYNSNGKSVLILCLSAYPVMWEKIWNCLIFFNNQVLI